MSLTVLMRDDCDTLQVDDDVYMQPQRLMAASLQWSRMGAGERVCLFRGACI